MAPSQTSHSNAPKAVHSMESPNHVPRFQLVQNYTHHHPLSPAK